MHQSLKNYSLVLFQSGIFRPLQLKYIMLQCLLSTNPLLRTNFQHLAQEISDSIFIFFTQILSFDYFTQYQLFILAETIKMSLPTQQLQ